ncbi:MAG TPA: hypothetical protein VN524_07145 [Hyphomicrobiaceae bacterium]|nr:hypothetical protein [Hyphomicrobiaceae bacterium]
MTEEERDDLQRRYIVAFEQAAANIAALVKIENEAKEERARGLKAMAQPSEGHP